MVVGWGRSMAWELGEGGVILRHMKEKAGVCLVTSNTNPSSTMCRYEVKEV